MSNTAFVIVLGAFMVLALAVVLFVVHASGGGPTGKGTPVDQVIAGRATRGTRQERTERLGRSALRASRHSSLALEWWVEGWMQTTGHPVDSRLSTGMSFSSAAKDAIDFPYTTEEERVFHFVQLLKKDGINL